MALEVLVAHTGQRLQVDTAQVSSLDELKAWVARQSSIPVQKIVALTPEGRGLKSQSLHSEKEIYIYDIRFTQPTSSGAGPSTAHEVPLPKRYSVPPAPNSIGDIKALAAWGELYKKRRAWSLEVAEECSRSDQATQQRYQEIDAMVKCLDAAVANLEFSIKQIEPKYADLKKWAEPALQEHEQLAANWEKYLALAKAIPISHSMVRFMTTKDVEHDQATLEDLIDMDTTRKAGRLAPTSLRKFGSKATDLDKAATNMYQALQDLVEEFENLISRSALLHNGESVQLQEDIEALAKKIDSDYQLILEYTTSQRDVLQASKTASTHTERLIPSLKKRAKEMGDMVHYATRARNDVAADSVKFMRSITEITSLHGSVKAQINALNQAEEDMSTFDYLRLIHQLPYMYASFVAESVRRREWYEKVRSDSSTLANTMALFQDEEMRRRRKWQKMVGSTYGRDKLDVNAMGLEVNLLGEEDPWPALTKQDLETFLGSLRKHSADPIIIDDVAKLLGELNSPTKQQSKRIKAFKNGSIHEASLGISGLLMRGDDDLIQSLQDDKTKLESKIKTSDSRIRRLEDLLHRQSQASRIGLGSVFQAQNSDSTSSVKSPVKQPDGMETILQRITQLEAELHAEQQRSAAAQKKLDAHAAQSNGIERQMEEANSTKKDLLQNMEALERDFVEERKSLEKEVRRLQTRLEDTEGEIENFGESRDHEKASLDQRVLVLQEEIQRLQQEKRDDGMRHQGQVDFLRNESRAQREHNEDLEKQVRALQEEAKHKTTALEEAVATGEARLYALHHIHGRIAPDKTTPQDAQTLVTSINATASDAMSRLQVAQDEVATLRSNLEDTRVTESGLRGDLQEASAKLTTEEKASSELKAELSEEKARSQALETELDSAKQQLAGLRAQIADGKTGSESLRKVAEEQEGKITVLRRELASKQAEVGRVEEELHGVKERFQGGQTGLARVTQHMDARAERAKDLTQRIYSQNERLCRLLERLGFAVSREGGTMAVQKIPRAERASHMQNTIDLSDPVASALRRSSSQLENGSADTTDSELLYWMNSKDEEVEAERYEAFMSRLGSFDIDLFSETIFRRVKDMEHLARKFQRDSRAYREKGLAFHREANEKIAFKNFKEGDLALFLPTRNQSSGAWACFNVGFPHYFLREHDTHGLRNREWLVARITRVQERVVDLSKSVQQPGDADSLNDEGNDNPFQLSDGLRWYLLDAHEDKQGAPSTPGLGKSTVAANTVEAVADMRTRSGTVGSQKNRLSQHSIEGVSKTLSKSLESRRGSTSSSRKTLPSAIGGGAMLKGTPLASETNSVRAAASETASGTSPTAGAKAGPSNAQPPAGGGGQAGASDGAAPESPVPHLSREPSAISADDPAERSVVYESLWSIDYSYESPSKKKDK